MPPPPPDHPPEAGYRPTPGHPSGAGSGPDAYPDLPDYPQNTYSPRDPYFSGYPPVPDYPPTPDYPPGPGHQPADHPPASEADARRARPAPAGGPGARRARPDPAAGPDRMAGPPDVGWAMLGYLSVPFFGFLLPLAVYLTSLRRARWLRVHAAQAINVWLTVILYELSAAIIGAMLVLDSRAVALAVVVPAVAALWLTTLVFLVRAATAARRGQTYTFPRWLCAPMVR